VNPGKQLSDLQKVDLDLERRAEALSQVEGRLGCNETLEQANGELEAKRKQLAELEKKQRELEYSTDDLLAQAKPLREKLYGGSVQNPKELAALEHKVEKLMGHIKAEEDKTLELMDQAEALQKESAAQAVKVEELEAEWQKMQEELLAEQSGLLSAIESAKEKREEILVTIDSAHLELYELVRARKQGVAIARIGQGRCQGCRIALSMSDMTRARTGDLVQCDSCGRILFLG